MRVVHEVISSLPLDRPQQVVERNEAMLLQPPPPPMLGMLGGELPPLAVHGFPVVYEPMPFARPRGVFEGPALRLEWQTLDGRQPFYHRNADVDEIGYQICGRRALITECGTVDFQPGQFSMIPMGVAHDNYCQDDIHLIFYLHGPAERGLEPVGHGTHRVPPFAGWEAKPMVETMTNGMGGPGAVISYCMADEHLILNAAETCDTPLEVLDPAGAPGAVEWVYRAPKVWVGHTRLERTRERRYHRYYAADEIQFQAEGERTIVSQRGVVTLAPGDFVSIPAGCSYASVTDGPSRHLSLLVTEATPAVTEVSRTADRDVLGWLAAHDARQLEAVA